MYVAQIALRWSDMDALGHVNNAQYLAYLEQARIEFLSEAAAVGVPREAAGLLVARHEIDYRRPMAYRREPIEIPTWIDRIGSTSFTFGHEIKDDETVYARARTVLVCIDDQAKPTPVPVSFRKFLQEHTKAS